MHFKRNYVHTWVMSSTTTVVPQPLLGSINTEMYWHRKKWHAPVMCVPYPIDVSNPLCYRSFTSCSILYVPHQVHDRIPTSFRSFLSCCILLWVIVPQPLRSSCPPYFHSSAARIYLVCFPLHVRTSSPLRGQVCFFFDLNSETSKYCLSLFFILVRTIYFTTVCTCTRLFFPFFIKLRRTWSDREWLNALFPAHRHNYFATHFPAHFIVVL